MKKASWTRKLDAYGRAQLADGLPSTGVDVTIRVNPSEEDPAHKAAQAGLQVQYQIDDILGGHVANEPALARVAELPYVEEIQVSRPLYSESQ